MNSPNIVSVIVPIHNSSNYLHRCIDSIISQSYANIEIIFVDDGSTDNSLQICNQYSDNRIHIFSQKNAGASSARNKGLDVCNGDWVIFVDSDDYISLTYIEHLVDAAVCDSNLDLVICGLTIHSRDSIQELYGGSINLNITSNKLEVLYNKYDLLKRGGPVAKLYNTKLIKKNNIRFVTDARFGEDTIFLHDYLRYCDCIKIIGETGYHVVSTPGSVSKRLYDVKNEISTFNNFSKLVPWYIEHLNDNHSKISIGKKKMLYLKRVILSLWKNPNSDNIKLEVLKSIDYSYVIPYDNNVLTKISINLLLAGHIKCFIKLLNLYYFIKKFSMQ